MSIHDLGKINDFLTMLITDYNLKNDAGLSRFIDVFPPVISKTRSGGLKFGATIMLRIHETTGIPIKKIRAAIEA